MTERQRKHWSREAIRTELRLEAELAAAKQVARYNEDVAGDAINSLREANKRIAELEALFLYPHMCRDGHEEIGYRTSGEDERCPLCQAKDYCENCRRDHHENGYENCKREAAKERGE
ncbi:MAG TPA: hypothetical protein VN633_17040 [Bryobacteraceae bacterium]|nr:hypothetical protein [Bryobacteraceae bacterium]